jgi:hypothetical protein
MSGWLNAHETANSLASGRSLGAVSLKPSTSVVGGGNGTLEHLVEGVTIGHASAVLAASIFHSARIPRRG